jgi:hypothetical protein
MAHLSSVGYTPWGKVNWVRLQVYGVDGKLRMEQVVRNNRTNMGALWEANTTFGTVADGTIGCIALSGTICTPTGTETAMLGEMFGTMGFQRASGTRQNYVAPTVLNGTYTMDIYNQFLHTGTGTAIGIGMAGLFNKPGSWAGGTGSVCAPVGTFYAFATFTQGAATLNVGEQLAVTWTVSS